MYKFFFEVMEQNGSNMLHGDYLDANLIDQKEYNKFVFEKQYSFGLFYYLNLLVILYGRYIYIYIPEYTRI